MNKLKTTLCALLATATLFVSGCTSGGSKKLAELRESPLHKVVQREFAMCDEVGTNYDIFLKGTIREVSPLDEESSNSYGTIKIDTDEGLYVARLNSHHLYPLSIIPMPVKHHSEELLFEELLTKGTEIYFKIAEYNDSYAIWDDPEEQFRYEFDEYRLGVIGIDEIIMVNDQS
ncbi:MAG: hypothetical protein KKH88_00920 [Nanoarchaeota archaeon]|nr:hypothetical protein [Nanoarchaeota archaeon]